MSKAHGAVGFLVGREGVCNAEARVAQKVDALGVVNGPLKCIPRDGVARGSKRSSTDIAVFGVSYERVLLCMVDGVCGPTGLDESSHDWRDSNCGTSLAPLGVLGKRGVCHAIADGDSCELP